MTEDAKRGRPTLYTEAIAEEILASVAAGATLNEICRREGMPSRPTVVLWTLQDREGFADRYARAKALQLEVWAEEIVEVSDDATNDWMERLDKEGQSIGWQLNGDHVQRSRLRVDSRKWMLAKLLPKQYGDKVQHGGDPDAPPIRHSVEMVIVDPNDPDEAA